MEQVTVILQPSDDSGPYKNAFDSLAEAINYLQQWQIALDATENINMAEAVVNF